MIETVTIVCGTALVLAILASLFRLVMGPTVLDRILAFDMITISAVAMMGMLSIRWETVLFLELILIFSMLGFFGTVAFVFYLQVSFPEHEDEEPEAPSDENGSDAGKEGPYRA